MNTDNKARLIEVADEAMYQYATLKEKPCSEPEFLADRIEAAGLLAGSVGVQSSSVDREVEASFEGWMPSYQELNAVGISQLKSVLKTRINKLLTRSPEPKGRWMEMLEEAYRVLKEAPDDIGTPALRIMAIQPLGMALEALRSAPRAKEE